MRLWIAGVSAAAGLALLGASFSAGFLVGGRAEVGKLAREYAAALEEVGRARARDAEERRAENARLRQEIERRTQEYAKVSAELQAALDASSTCTYSREWVRAFNALADPLPRAGGSGAVPAEVP